MASLCFFTQEARRRKEEVGEDDQVDKNLDKKQLDKKPVFRQHSLHNKNNNNGNMLIEFAMRKNLFIQ